MLRFLGEELRSAPAALLAPRELPVRVHESINVSCLKALVASTPAFSRAGSQHGKRE